MKQDFSTCNTSAPFLARLHAGLYIQCLSKTGRWSQIEKGTGKENTGLWSLLRFLGAVCVTYCSICINQSNLPHLLHATVIGGLFIEQLILAYKSQYHCLSSERAHGPVVSTGGDVCVCSLLSLSFPLSFSGPANGRRVPSREAGPAQGLALWLVGSWGLGFCEEPRDVCEWRKIENHWIRLTQGEGWIQQIHEHWYYTSTLSFLRLDSIGVHIPQGKT